MEFGIFSEFHDRATEGARIVDDGFPVAEYVLKHVDINLDRIVLENILQGMEPGAGMFVIFRGNSP